MSESISVGDTLRAWLLADTLNFTRYFFKQRFKRKFIVGHHHEAICHALNRVLSGETRRLIINMAPRYGKTEVAVKNFIANGFALNPQAKFIHLSYSADLAISNSAEIRGLMDEPAYRSLFPGATPVTRGAKKWTTAADGGLYAVSTAGQVTGFGAGLVEEDTELQGEIEAIDNSGASKFGGAIVIDDPLKPEDALSDNVREKINIRFETTIRSRVNSRNTPIVIIMQRLHEHDLCGYLLEREPDEWEVLTLPVITEVDGHREPLWPFKHNLKELEALEAANPYVFETQYMQNPQPLEGLMYHEFGTYVTLPTKGTRKNYTDTADTGSDYLCSISYVEAPEANYIIDVEFTDKPMEYTEPAVAEHLLRNKIQICTIESNNGGRAFRRNVQRLTRELGNAHTSFRDLTQTNNKQVRIFSRSSEVNNLCLMPTDWEHRWPKFATAIKGYRKAGGNAHDDAPDALTGTVEMRAATSSKAYESIRRRLL